MTQKIKTFPEAAAALFHDITALPWQISALIQPVRVVALIGLGALIKLVLDPATSTVLIAAFGAWVAVALLRARSGNQLGTVDWATAEPYWGKAAAELPASAVETVERIRNATLAQSTGIDVVHPYIFPCPDDRRDGSCKHALCANACGLPVGRRRMLAFGVRILALPPDVREFVLWHEMRHGVGFMRWASIANFSLGFVGWVAVGALPFDWTALLVMWLGSGALRWWTELVCDLFAARRVGAAHGIELFGILARWQKASSASLSQKLCARLLMLVTPSHPPHWLRTHVMVAAGWIHSEN